MKRLKRMIGWFLVIVGGWIFAMSVICLGALLLGVLEGIESVAEGAAMAICFLIDMALAGLMVKIGWKWRRKPVKEMSTKTPIAPAAAKTESSNEPVKTPVYIAAERQMIRNEVSTLQPAKGMKALAYDPNPFMAYQEEDAGLDAFYDRNYDIQAYYVLLPGYSLQEAFEQCMAYKDPERHAFIRIPEEVLAGNALEPDQKILERCRENRIHIVRYAGEYRIYDFCNDWDYMVLICTWPGSADDAATYGEWSFGVADKQLHTNKLSNS